MLEQTQVIIVGMGLMGGSLALALRGRVQRIIAIDQNAETRRLVQENNAADAVYAQLADVTIRPDDLIVLATPVRSIVTMINELPQIAPDGCLLVDFGSTKWDVCCAMDQLPDQFEAIGGHPMCGREISGFSAAIPDLYHKQTFILIETERTTPLLYQLAQEIIATLNAIPINVPIDKHDYMLGMISHTPHVLSMLLMTCAWEWSDDDPTAWHVSSSAFAGMTRLAGSDPAMWRDIFITNREAILAHLQHYRDELDMMMAMLSAAEPQKITDWIAMSQAHYTAYRNEKETFQERK